MADHCVDLYAEEVKGAFEGVVIARRVGSGCKFG